MPEVSKFLMPAALAAIMLGIGLTITFADFRRVFIQPKAVVTGLACQMILLPVLAFVIAIVSPIHPAYKAGLILIACCPGGTASNLVTHLLRGRVALSVSMTAINSLLTIFTIPAILSLATDIFLSTTSDIHLSISETVINLLITVLLPVVAGILIRNWRPGLAERLKDPLRYVLPGILIAVYAYLLFFKGSNDYAGAILGNLRLLIPTVALNLSSIILGFVITGFLSVTHEGRFTIAIEVGLQNSALALFIGDQLLENPEMVTVALIYGGFSFFTTFALGYLLKIKVWKKVV